MEISIKEILVLIEKMDMENLSGQMEMFIKVNLGKICEKGKD